jgi:hypothetical protein
LWGGGKEEKAAAAEEQGRSERRGRRGLEEGERKGRCEVAPVTAVGDASTQVAASPRCGPSLFGFMSLLSIYPSIRLFLSVQKKNDYCFWILIVDMLIFFNV